MRHLAYLLPILACCGCTKQLKVDDISVKWSAGRLENIVIRADADSIRTMERESAMFVALFPCRSQSENERLYYPIYGGEVTDKNGQARLVFKVASDRPQPQSLNHVACAQVLADGMSVRHYRSNVVRTHGFE